MTPYPSIETVFTRDKITNRLNFGELRNSANSMVKEWTVSEKIDGQNIRVIITLGGVEIRGRGDNAQIHPHMIDTAKTLFDHAKVVAYFTEYRGKTLPDDWSVTFYGEGYGAGIQKGAAYSPVKKFRCFDLMLGADWWVDDDEMRRVCSDLDVPVVPHIGNFSSLEILTRADLKELIPLSIVSREDSGLEHEAEGIVVKPRIVLKDRHGDRIVWKITFREFKC